ncbi:MAG: ATP-binding protein [Anaerolineae bacterium]
MITKLKTFFWWLLAVSPSIIDPEARRQSRLLSAMLFVVFAALLNVDIRTGLRSMQRHTLPIESFFISFFMIIDIGLIALNRRGYYLTTARLLVITAFLGLFVYSFFWYPGAIYLPVLVLVAALFLPNAEILVTAGASIAAMILLGFVNWGHPPTTFSIGGVVDFIVATLLIVITYIIHRRALETERRKVLQNANDALRLSEASLEKRVMERTRDLHLASDVSRQLTTILDLDDLLRAVVERTREAFNLNQVGLFLAEDAEILVCAGAAGPAAAYLYENKPRLRIHGDGLIAAAAHSREIVLVGDVSKDSRYLVFDQMPSTASELAIPMIVGSTLVGVLDIQDEKKERFSPEDVRILSSVAEQTTIAVQNARLFRAVRDAGDETKRLYDEQVRFTEQLRQLDQLKSHFLASVSHELRTPLNAILNFTEFVSMGLMGEINDRQKDALNKALDSGRHLLSLINDVLDITKIESGMLNLFIEDNIDLNDELNPVIEAVQSMLTEKRVAFQAEIEQPLPPVRGDRRRIRQVLYNLLSNAAKFTEEGTITLRVCHNDGVIEFAVIDTGPGIPKEQQSIIFEPFTQTESGIRHAGGTGLGLPISLRLIQAHGGRLWVESEPGHGATFYVSLPTTTKNSDPALA